MKPLETFGDPADPYVITQELGGGMQARVYKCRKGSDANGDQPFAVKVVQHKRVLNETERETQVAHLLREAEILQNLHHPKIVNLVQTLRDDEHVFLVMEYVSNGDLFDKIASRKGLAEVEAKYVFQQLLEALLYMHEEKVIHRDLKPENILVGKEVSVKENDKETTYFEVKIADFGLSKLLTEESVAKTHVGTPYYWAPEVIKASQVQHTRREAGGTTRTQVKGGGKVVQYARSPTNGDQERGSSGGHHSDSTKTDFAVYSEEDMEPGMYDDRVDLWSLGVVLYVMLLGHYPFNKKRELPLHDQIMQGLPLNKLARDKKTKHLSPEVQDLIARLLTPDPVKRLKLRECFHHPWVNLGSEYFQKRKHPILSGHIPSRIPVRYETIPEEAPGPAGVEGGDQQEAAGPFSPPPRGGGQQMPGSGVETTPEVVNLESMKGENSTIKAGSPPQAHVSPGAAGDKQQNNKDIVEQVGGEPGARVEIKENDRGGAGGGVGAASAVSGKAPANKTEAADANLTAHLQGTTAAEEPAGAGSTKSDSYDEVVNPPFQTRSEQTGTPSPRQDVVLDAGPAATDGKMKAQHAAHQNFDHQAGGGHAGVPSSASSRLAPPGSGVKPKVLAVDGNGVLTAAPAPASGKLGAGTTTAGGSVIGSHSPPLHPIASNLWHQGTNDQFHGARNDAQEVHLQFYHQLMPAQRQGGGGGHLQPFGNPMGLNVHENGGDHLFHELLQLQVTIAKCLESAYLAYRGADLSAPARRSDVRQRGSSAGIVDPSGTPGYAEMNSRSPGGRNVSIHTVRTSTATTTTTLQHAGITTGSSSGGLYTSADSGVSRPGGSSCSSDSGGQNNYRSGASGGGPDGRGGPAASGQVEDTGDHDGAVERQVMLGKLRNLAQKCFQVTAYKAYECVTRYGATARRVREDVLPDMSLAIEEDAPELAQEFLETINGWVTDMKNRGSEMEDAYREISQDIRLLIDSTHVIKKAVDTEIANHNELWGSVMLSTTPFAPITGCTPPPLVGGAHQGAHAVGPAGAHHTTGGLHQHTAGLVMDGNNNHQLVAANNASVNVMAAASNVPNLNQCHDLYQKIHQLVSGQPGSVPTNETADIDAQVIDLLFFTPNLPRSQNVESASSDDNQGMEPFVVEDNLRGGGATIEEVRSSSQLHQRKGSEQNLTTSQLATSKVGPLQSREVISKEQLSKDLDQLSRDLDASSPARAAVSEGGEEGGKVTAGNRNRSSTSPGLLENSNLLPPKNQPAPTATSSSSSAASSSSGNDVQNPAGLSLPAGNQPTTPVETSSSTNNLAAPSTLLRPTTTTLAVNGPGGGSAGAAPSGTAYWTEQQRAQQIRHRSAIALMRAVSALRKVDEVLQRSTMFWSHLGMTTSQVAQMKDTLTLWIKHASSNEKLRQRLNERLEQYRKFWLEFETCSLRYCEELREGCNRMFSFLTQMETRADCLDTVKSMIS
ncbi:unnamed protein product [Amoebophrya sp. A25]|nr:unnamed protein product [Amoebophrya sp. A25]|eukprot:GSA25T00000874001.1